MLYALQHIYTCENLVISVVYYGNINYRYGSVADRLADAGQFATTAGLYGRHAQSGKVQVTFRNSVMLMVLGKIQRYGWAVHR